VLIPGDPERISRAERIKNGVPVDEETWRELTIAARSVNVLVEAPRYGRAPKSLMDGKILRKTGSRGFLQSKSRRQTVEKGRPGGRIP
jgi:hypothetical protein